MSPLDVTEMSVAALLRKRVERAPDRVFINCGGAQWSYGAFNDVANRFAGLLARLGLKPGDKLGIMLPNSPEFLFAWFGAAKAGLVYVPINTEYRGQILSHQLHLADVKTMVIGAQFLDRLAAVSAQLPQLERVIVHGEATADGLPKRIQRLAFAEMQGFGTDEPDTLPAHSDPFAISYTSGTTGPSKGALTTNSHVLTFARDFVTLTEFDRDDRLYTSLPLFHALAAWLGVLTTLVAGGECLVVERFSPSRFWDDVRAYKATIGHTIFSIVPLLMKQPERSDDAKSTLRRVYLAQRNPAFEERFNCKIHDVYGQSETGIVTGVWPGAEQRLGSCGKANEATYEVKIVDDEDREVPPGTVGEFIVRPKRPYSMMNEYYNMPKETVGAFRNLWFHTGDSGRMDEDGYFYFVDRKKDALRRRGENISSFELESVVMQHSAVAECAAVAVPSPLTEDDVKIVVVLKPGESLDADALWAFCDDHMPRFWVPRYIEFRTSLPRTPTEKIEKYKLRQGLDGGNVFDRDATKPA